jgi:hypothetical protein
MGMFDAVFQKVISHARAAAPDVVVAAVERALFTGTLSPFKPQDRRRAMSLLSTFRKSLRISDWAPFSEPFGRRAFLAAAQSFLRSRDREFAVVGIGTWTESRSTVREVFVRQGGTFSVRLPESVSSEIRGHIEVKDSAEVLYVHNHAEGLHREIKNAIVGRAPVPSTGDRDLLLQYAEAAFNANTDGGRRRVRFYLVENDLVHEFTLPPWQVLRSTVLPFFEHLFGQS